MEIEKIALFINRLSERSKMGAIPWVVDSTNSYSAELGKYSISISEQYGDNVDPEYSEPDYFISIYKDNAKNWVDSVNDNEMKDVLPGAFKIMQSIYRDARRTARGFGAVIDDLLQALNDDQ